MTDVQTAPHARQRLFRSMILGTLIYSVVLGLFNDYTSILHTRSYSTTFAVAVVMQILTYGTFFLKDWTVAWCRGGGLGGSKPAMLSS